MSADVNIVIPTYNRASIIGDAIDNALQQTYAKTVVTVVNDGSSDATRDEVAPFLCDERVRYIELSNNVGTAQAKNVAIALNDCPFITFHDSDDFPHHEKVAKQVEIATRRDIKADPILNWSLANTEPDSVLDVDLVVHEHTLVDVNGDRHHMKRALSLVDDAFPQLQMASGVPGDWILINCGLFRASIFSEIGGFKDCIEEDREIRNRIIFNGRVIWLIPEILMTKIECIDSLTIVESTNYQSALRKKQRQELWQDAARYRQGHLPDPISLDLTSVGLNVVSYDASLSAVIMNEASVVHLEKCLKALRPSSLEAEPMQCIA